MEKRYRVYSQYLKEKYGEKVYKIPLNIPVSCPNRDGLMQHSRGCIFCGELGAGFESLDSGLAIEEQLEKNIMYISGKYKAKKFIAYFQNFSNTYLELSCFKKFINASIREGIVEIAISTRPDCINDAYLEYLKEIKEEKKLNIVIELGLQSVNYNTLHKINRGHTLAEFIDAVMRIKRYQLECCVHMIINLPWDNFEDVIEGSKILSALEVEQVKLHSLYILRDTELGRLYKEQAVEIISMDEYVERIIAFIEYLSPQIIIQRLLGRAPEENTLFCNWGKSWWKIRDLIDHELSARDSYQGKKCDYLNGRAVRHLVDR
ncbi:MAG: TIGR01212 family radical SAM protein [Alkaliphilus sp.]|nr:TIGR01212 family radical SAM protein [Alkaliphilus sp.]